MAKELWLISYNTLEARIEFMKIKKKIIIY